MLPLTKVLVLQVTKLFLIPEQDDTQIDAYLVGEYLIATDADIDNEEYRCNDPHDLGKSFAIPFEHVDVVARID